jgi:hypothetical protein
MSTNGTAAIWGTKLPPRQGHSNGIKANQSESSLKMKGQAPYNTHAAPTCRAEANLGMAEYEIYPSKSDRIRLKKSDMTHNIKIDSS